MTPTGSSPLDTGSTDLDDFLTALDQEGFVIDRLSSTFVFELITVGTLFNPVSDGAAPIFYNVAAFSGDPFEIDAEFELPVTYVSYFGARMYAWYYGMDLPTNAQWDWAASGSHDVVEYPSGIVPKCHENSVCETDRPEAHFGGDVVEPEGLPGVVHMHDNVSEWVRDWQPFQNKPNEDEEPDHVLARQMEDKRNPVNNVGHNMPGLNLDVAYQRKTIKGGNYSQITSELTNNQQATFAHANFMGPTVGFRVASRTESWDEAAISLSSI